MLSSERPLKNEVAAAIDQTIGETVSVAVRYGGDRSEDVRPPKAVRTMTIGRRVVRVFLKGVRREYNGGLAFDMVSGLYLFKRVAEPFPSCSTSTERKWRCGESQATSRTFLAFTPISFKFSKRD